MKLTINNQQILTIRDACTRCGQQTRVVYTLTDEDGKKECYVCEDCVSKDDNVE